MSQSGSQSGFKFQQPVSAAFGWLADSSNSQSAPPSTSSMTSSKAEPPPAFKFQQPVSAAFGWTSDSQSQNSAAASSAAPSAPAPAPAPFKFQQPISAAFGWASEAPAPPPTSTSMASGKAAETMQPPRPATAPASSEQKITVSLSNNQAPADTHTPKALTPGVPLAFLKEYNFGRQLGEGAFAVVRECFNADKERFAVKIVRKSLEEAKNAMVRREIAIMKELRHSPKVFACHIQGCIFCFCAIFTLFCRLFFRPDCDAA